MSPPSQLAGVRRRGNADPPASALLMASAAEDIEARWPRAGGNATAPTRGSGRRRSLSACAAGLGICSTLERASSSTAASLPTRMNLAGRVRNFQCPTDDQTTARPSNLRSQARPFGLKRARPQSSHEFDWSGCRHWAKFLARTIAVHCSPRATDLEKACVSKLSPPTCG